LARATFNFIFLLKWHGEKYWYKMLTWEYPNLFYILNAIQWYLDTNIVFTKSTWLKDAGHIHPNHFICWTHKNIKQWIGIVILPKPIKDPPLARISNLQLILSLLFSSSKGQKKNLTVIDLLLFNYLTCG